jgi:hypothetical protein
MSNFDVIWLPVENIGCEIEEVAGVWRKLLTEELHN